MFKRFFHLQTVVLASIVLQVYISIILFLFSKDLVTPRIKLKETLRVEIQLFV